MYKKDNKTETFINLLDIKSKLFFNYIFVAKASRSKLFSPCHIKIKLKTHRYSSSKRIDAVQCHRRSYSISTNVTF